MLRSAVSELALVEGATVFGPLQTAGHAYAAVVPAFVQAALTGQPLTVHGDGRQSRDFTYACRRRGAHPRRARPGDLPRAGQPGLRHPDRAARRRRRTPLERLRGVREELIRTSSPENVRKLREAAAQLVDRGEQIGRAPAGPPPRRPRCERSSRRSTRRRTSLRPSRRPRPGRPPRSRPWTRDGPRR
jgi:hypothetical protein